MVGNYLKRALICGLALSTLSYAQAFAEEAEQVETTDEVQVVEQIDQPEMAPADDLGEVVVTAQRMPSKKLETPANVVIVSEQEIADNHYQTVAEALENINGVTITSMGGGQVDYVTINGDQRVVVMLDGIRLNNDQGAPSGHYSVELDMIPTMDNIQRIEVVKGGASALYGSDAVGGVINIITKKNYKNKTTIGLNYGSWGNSEKKITTMGHDGTLDWFVSGSLIRQGNFHFKDAAGNNQTMPSSDFTGNNFSVKLRNSFSDSNSATIVFNHHAIDANVWENPIPYNGVDFGQNTFAPHLDGLYNNISISYDFKEDKDVAAHLRYYNNYKSIDLGGKYSTRTQGIEYQDGWKLNDEHTLIAGAEYRWSNSDSESLGYDGKDVNTKSIYLQDTYKFAPKWTLIPGVRVDIHSEAGTHWSPKIALNYKADDKTNIYANWGKVFKSPTVDDMYTGWGGNPDLKPETGWVASLGMNHRFDKKNSMDMNIFISKLNDAIKWAPLGAGGMWRPYNVDEEKKRGLEINFKSKLTDNWTVNAGYSYIRSEVNSELYLNNPQPNGYRLGIAYKNRDFKANLHAIMANGLSKTVFADNRNAVINFNASYDINENINVYFKALNLTNQHYAVSTSKSYPAQGRFFQVGVNFSF